MELGIWSLRFGVWGLGFWGFGISLLDFGALLLGLGALLLGSEALLLGIGDLLLQMVLKRDTFLTQIEMVQIIFINGFHLRQVMEVISSTLLPMVVEAVVEDRVEVEEVPEVWLSFITEAT